MLIFLIITPSNFLIHFWCTRNQIRSCSWPLNSTNQMNVVVINIKSYRMTPYWSLSLHSSVPIILTLKYFEDQIIDNLQVSEYYVNISTSPFIILFYFNYTTVCNEENGSFLCPEKGPHINWLFKKRTPYQLVVLKRIPYQLVVQK